MMVRMERPTAHLALFPPRRLLRRRSRFAPRKVSVRGCAVGGPGCRGYCTQAANGAARTETFLGERLRRLSKRLGGNRAKCAVGRSILTIIWHLLASPEARFTDLGPDWHNRKTDRDRKIRATSASSTPSAPTSPSHPPPDTPTPADQARPPRRHGPLNHARVRLLILTVSSGSPVRILPGALDFRGYPGVTVACPGSQSRSLGA